MASDRSQVPSNADLRSLAKETRRGVKQKAKWARGATHFPGKPCPYGDVDDCTCGDRPKSKPTISWRQLQRKDAHRVMNKDASSNINRTALHHDLTTDDFFAGPSDSSADEDIRDASAAPEPTADAEIMYSYDAPAGPGKGSQILSVAINRAVERFENQETEKLAKEYDFVDDKEHDGDGDYFADEDDFELVPHTPM